MSSSDDELPPLEDMSHAFEAARVEKPKELARTEGGHISGEDKRQIVTIVEPSTTKPKPAPTPAELAAKPNGFACFSKGFLSNPAKKKPTKKTKTPKDEIIELNANTQAKSSLVFEDVQEKMHDQMDGFLKKNEKEWCNDDLLDKVSKNEDMMKQLDDPAVNKALEWMQKDPKAATEYYKNHDPAMLDMFQSFMGLLGNHMVDLDSQGDRKNKVLAKPKIKELVNYLKTNPDRANHMIRANTDPEFQEDVRFLLSNGLVKL